MRARRDGGSWVLSGQKYYVSHVDNADALLTVARVEDELKVFLVPTDAPGLTKSPIAVEILSPSASTASSTTTSAWTTPRWSDPTPAWPSSTRPQPGTHRQRRPPERHRRYAIDIAVAYARERTVWDVPIGAHQAVSHPRPRRDGPDRVPPADHVRRPRLRRRRTRRRGGGHGQYTASEAASTALDAAMQTLGGNGMSREYGLATLHGLVRLFRIAPVSSEMLLNHIAHKRLSLPRSY